jgi:hypothetical protein
MYPLLLIVCAGKRKWLNPGASIRHVPPKGYEMADLSLSLAGGQICLAVHRYIAGRSEVTF